MITYSDLESSPWPHFLVIVNKNENNIEEIQKIIKKFKSGDIFVQVNRLNQACDLMKIVTVEQVSVHMIPHDHCLDSKNCLTSQCYSCLLHNDYLE